MECSTQGLSVLLRAVPGVAGSAQDYVFHDPSSQRKPSGTDAGAGSWKVTLACRRRVRAEGGGFKAFALGTLRLQS